MIIYGLSPPFQCHDTQMKRGLMIAGCVVAVLVAGAFIYDAMNAKPQREILIDHDYVPKPARPAPAMDPADDTLTPLPE